jgi:hypothetical protein
LILLFTNIFAGSYREDVRTPKRNVCHHGVSFPQPPLPTFWSFVHVPSWLRSNANTTNVHILKDQHCRKVAHIEVEVLPSRFRSFARLSQHYPPPPFTHAHLLFLPRVSYFIFARSRTMPHERGSSIVGLVVKPPSLWVPPPPPLPPSPLLLPYLFPPPSLCPSAFPP